MPVEIYTALLGVFVGGFITYYFSFKLATEQQRLIAISNFRAPFASISSQMAIAQIDSSINKMAILNDSFKDISVALELFRPYVKANKKAEYQKAWQDYYSDGTNGKIHFSQYTAKDIDINGVKKEPYKLFNERINHILSFANP